VIFRNALSSGVTNPEEWFVDLLGGSNRASSGEDVTVKSAVNVPTVYTCVDILASSIATMPFQTFRRTESGREREHAHVVPRLMEVRPNPYQSPFTFKHLAETHRNLWGNAYINVKWRPDGLPKELWLLDPSVTEPVLDVQTGQLWYQTVLPDGEHKYLQHVDVIHLHTMSLDGLKGKTPIQAAREAIGSSQAAQKFKGKFFSNGATTSGALKASGQLNREAKKKIREEWEHMTAGLDNAERIAILDAGLEWQDIGMPLRDAQFIEGMKFDKSEIANIYHIPLHMINELDRSTHSNIEQQALDFIQNTLQPIVVQYEEEFTYKLFTEPELARFYLKANIQSLLRADSTSRANFYQTMIEIGALSINEVRALEEMNAIEGGDQHRVDLNHVDIRIAEEYQLARARRLEGGDDE